MIFEDLEYMMEKYNNDYCIGEYLKQIKEKYKKLENNEALGDVEEIISAMYMIVCRVYALEKGKRANTSSDINFLSRKNEEYTYAEDEDVLREFYNFYKGISELYYQEIEEYQFENDGERKHKVNLTIWDYCNRIKTFSRKYLCTMYPDVKENKIVFIYNNLETILGRFQVPKDDFKGRKQLLNIRSALRKLNDFKQNQQSK